ncbi:hypothetical protein WA026_006785 [Henosepilachna vigintioctopunctata]|uniref:Uncharacterized protein n=1 Tax=Henosepilachna vigintioctopunctata TaxID=420089 RepID=A0AAW1UI07_9CUCU
MMSSPIKNTKKPQLKWTRTLPLRRPDYIKSSVFTERGEMGFVPTYDHGRPNLGCLLNYEYFRMWFKERDLYQKDTYTKQNTKNKDKFFTRRFVQRYINHVDKQKLIPMMTMKQFQNVPAVESTSRGDKLKGGTKSDKYVRKVENEKMKQFVRYKPECSRSKMKKEEKNMNEHYIQSIESFVQIFQQLIS